MCDWSPRRSRFLAIAGGWLVVSLLVSACANPPNKEMDQAQGAIDTARAAGADRFAADEYAAATTALKQSNDAVAQRDYRLALNFALESREHAQNAAREAANRGAQVRGEVERSMAEIAALMAQVNTELAAAERARRPRRVLRDARQALVQVNADVQKAGAAMRAGNYAAAEPTLRAVKARIEQTMAALAAAATTQSPRQRK